MRRQRVQAANLYRARLMRREPTKAEALLWEHLKARQLHGFKFRRQYAIDGYIVDFYCPETKLVVELDGPSHDDRQKYDRDRTLWLECYDMRVVRFPNQTVLDDLDQVLNSIHQLCLAQPA
jgi:very-short-patch-repair endonuclease